MSNGKRRITLVYQAGIAHVFDVTLPMQATRLFQGSHEACRAFAMGCGAMGASVRSAHCNMAGDVTDIGNGIVIDVENAVFNPPNVRIN